MKHTPGPWKHGRYTNGGKPEGHWHIWGGFRGKVIASLPLEHGESEANARLIAKAPELRDVLARIIDWVDAGCDPSRRSMNDARALLASIDNP